MRKLRWREMRVSSLFLCSLQLRFTALIALYDAVGTPYGTRGRRLPSTSTYSYNAPNSTDPSSTPETTLERLRRLRSEVQELEDDIKREKALAPPESDEKEGEEDKGKGKKREVSATVVLQQLRLLRNDLGALPEGIEVEGNGPVSLEQKLKSSEAFLAREKQAQDSVGVEGDGKLEVIAVGKEDEGVLETRLSQIEKMVGARESDVNGVRPSTTPPIPH